VIHPLGPRQDGRIGSLAVGFLLGLSVAVQAGPISLLLTRTVLRGAVRAGLAIGLGAAVGRVLAWRTLDDGR
jgi:threonine/homoserine/homoserine lactone efflux protein